MKNILVLFASVPKNQSDDNWLGFGTKLQAELNKDTHKISISALTELGYLANGKKSKIWHLSEGYDLKDFDLIVIRNSGKYKELAKCVANYAKLNQIKLIDRFWTKISISGDKLSCSFLRASHNIPTPITLGAKNNIKLLKALKQTKLDFPLICKDNDGKKGRNNYLVPNISELKDILSNNPDISFVLQEYITNNGDYRILVMGSSAPLIFLRQGDKSKTHLNNTSQGGKSTLINPEDLDPEIMKLAIKAAKIEKISLAGVDIITNSETNKHYILEVNTAPQIHSGAFIPEKTAAYANFLKLQSDKSHLIKDKTSADLPNSLLNRPIIGRRELISFSSMGLSDIPAKVDSGAYSSVLHVKSAIVDPENQDLIVTFDNNKTLKYQKYYKIYVRPSTGKGEV
jgi:glutathione synthase/RimK-type ligase-like ATP-grasp enzyme